VSETMTEQGPSNDVVAEFIRAYRTQKRVVSSENGALRNIVRLGKRDGIDTKAAIRTANALQQDPEEVRVEMRHTIHYMNIASLPVSQIDLFAGWQPDVTDKTKTATDLWDVEEAGYQAGRHGGKIDDNPYPPGSEFFVHWREWWHKGQAAIARELGPDVTPAPSVRSRGRQLRIPGTEHIQRRPNSEDGAIPADVVSLEAVARKRGGRPKGSKNKKPGQNHGGTRKGAGRRRPQIAPDGVQVY